MFTGQRNNKLQITASIFCDRRRVLILRGGWSGLLWERFKNRVWHEANSFGVVPYFPPVLAAVNYLQIRNNNNNNNNNIISTARLDICSTMMRTHAHGAPCGLWGCKNGPAPFPGWMSYKATKPCLVSVLYLSMRYNYGIVVY